MRRPTPLGHAVRWLLIVMALAWSAFPILLVVASSFKEASEIFEVPPTLIFRPTFENYRTLWDSRPEFFRALGSSVIVTIGTVLLTILASTCAGYVYARYRNRLLKVIPFTRPAPARRIALAWRKGFARTQAIKVLAQAISQAKITGILPLL